MTSDANQTSNSTANGFRQSLPLRRREYLKFTGTATAGTFTAIKGVTAKDNISQNGNKDTNPRSPTDLRVEYATEPLGIDIEKPRLSWRLAAPGYGWSQSAYRILVASTQSKLNDDNGNIWDTGRVKSSRSVNIEYDGPPLKPKTTYHWKVRTWDKDENATNWSDSSFWETGLLNEEDWSAQWIGRNRNPDSSNELPGVNWTDYSFEGDLTLFEAAAGLVFRAQDSDNLYMWQINTARSSEPLLRPHVREDGSWSTLESVNLQNVMGENPNEQHHIQIEVVNQQITTAIDGQQVHQVIDNTHSAGTIGFRQNGAEHARFDNIVVTDPQGDVLFEETFENSIGDTFSGGSIENGQLDIQGGGIVLRSDGRLNPSPLLRSEVSLKQNISDAKVHISGIGFYELYINVERVGDQVLDPAQTDYEHTVLYASHDISSELQRGNNALGVALGRGRYGEPADNVWEWDDSPWWSDPELRLQIEITFEDGSTTTLTSNEDWRVTDGPTRRDSLYAGEFYDAREEKHGWKNPGYDDSEWESVDIVEGPSGNLTAQHVQPIKTFETIEPIAVTEPSPNVFVFDVGQMIAGWTELTVEGSTGTTVKLTMGEKLHDDGTVNNDNGNVSKPMQTDIYVLNGEGTESWESRFSYKGFRYIQVEGYPGTPATNDITATVVHSAIDEDVNSDFTCSNDLLTQIHKNTQWAFLNNYHGIPTDTPTFEKNGWTADALLTAETGMFNYRLARFYTKWLADVRDAQLDAPEVIDEQGNVPVIVPTANWGYEGWTPDPAWQSVYPLLTWWVYQYYGDQRILENHYNGIQSLIQYYQRKADGNIIRAGLGDWVAPGGGSVPPEGPGIVSTAYYYRSVEILGEISSVLGRSGDAEEYNQLAADIKSAFNDEFFDSSANTYSTGNVNEYRQTSNIFPLAYDLFPKGHEDAVAKNLTDDIMQVHDGHLNTGAHGTKYLLPVLTEYGYHEIAYTVATQRTYPSWGNWVESDITALLERWALDARSRDHHFLGSIDEWFYKYLAGIREPVEPGFKHVEIAPELSKELNSAEASTDTIRGKIASSWKRTETTKESKSTGGFSLKVEIPGNTTGTIRIPTLGSDSVDVREKNELIWQDEKEVDGDHRGVKSVERDSDRIVTRVGSGSYQFELDWIARLQPSTTSATIGERISFEVEDTSGKDQQIESLEWDFGDGTTATGRQNAHRYGSPGEYEATLTATDNAGNSTTDVVIINVSKPKMTLAEIQPSTTNASINERVMFQVEDTSGKDHRIESLEWDFGDGTTATGRQNAHRYASPGVYQVILTATDYAGISTTDSVTITVGSVLIESFEDTDLSEYKGDIDGYSVTKDGPVSEGSASLKTTVSGEEQRIASVSSLSRYPSAGNIIKYDFQIGSNSDTLTFVFGAQSASVNPENRYDLNLHSPSNSLFLYRIKDGNPVEMSSTSVDFDSYVDEWIEGTIIWDSVDAISCNLIDSQGTEICRVSASDDSFRQGGIGFRAEKTDESSGIIVDNVRMIPLDDNTSDRPGPVVGDSKPADLDGDGKYEDINGDGEGNYDDVVDFFDNFDDSAVQANSDAFDFNENGHLDFDDIIELFRSY